MAATSTNSADIGIRVFLQDAASAGLFAIDSNLGRAGQAARTAGLLFGDMSLKLAGLAVVAGLTVSFIGFAGAIYYAVQQGQELKQALTDIALAAGMTTTQVQALQPFLLNLGADSIYSLQELADGMATVAQYGFKTTQQLEDMATAGKDLAEATGSTTVDAFKLLAVTMQAFNIPASQAGQVAAILFYSIEHGTPNISNLTSALGQLGGVAVSLHLSLQDIIPALDTVSVGMGSASTAAAGLRYFLINIVHPTSAAATELQKIGISAFDAQGNFLGLKPILQDISDVVSGLSDKAKSDILGTLFNIRSGSAIKQLLDQIKQYEAGVNSVNDVTQLQYQLQQAVTQVMQQLGPVIHEITSNLQDFAALVGTTIVPVLVGFLSNVVNPLVKQMRLWAQDPSSAQLVRLFLELGAAISGIGLIIIGSVFSPLMLFVVIMVGVAGAVVGLALLISNWGSVMQKLQPIIDGVRAALPFLAAGLLGVAAALIAVNSGSIIGFLGTVVGAITTAAGAAWGAVVAFDAAAGSLARVGLNAVITAARWVASIIPALISGAATAWSATISFLSGLIPAIASAAVTAWSATIAFLTGLIPSLLSAAASALGAMAAFFTGLIPSLLSLTAAAWGATLSFLSGLLPALATATGVVAAYALAFIGLIVHTVALAVANIGLAATTLLAIGPYILLGVAIAGAIAGLVLLIQHFGGLNTIIAIGRAIWATLLPVLQEAWQQIRGAFLDAIKQLQPVWQQLVQAFNQAKPVLMVLGAILGGVLLIALMLLVVGFRVLITVLVVVLTTVIHIVAGIVQAFAGVVQFFLGFFTVLRGIFTGNTQLIQQGFSQMGQGILNIIKGLWSAVSAVFIGAFNLIKGIITSFISGVISFFTNLANQLVHHSIIPDMLSAIVSVILGFVPRALSAFEGFVSGLVSKAEQLPGKIKGALGNLGSLLLSSGQALIQGFINGIQSMVGALTGAVGGILNSVRNMFPHSPAKEGPLTDAHLWMPNLVHMLSDTADKAGPSLKASMSRVAGAAKAGLGAPSGGSSSASGGAGGETYTLTVDGKALMSFFHNRLTGELQANGVGRLQR